MAGVELVAGTRVQPVGLVLWWCSEALQCWQWLQALPSVLELCGAAGQGESVLWALPFPCPGMRLWLVGFVPKPAQSWVGLCWGGALLRKVQTWSGWWVPHFGGLKMPACSLLFAWNEQPVVPMKASSSRDGCCCCWITSLFAEHQLTAAQCQASSGAVSCSWQLVCWLRALVQGYHTNRSMWLPGASSQAPSALVAEAQSTFLLLPKSGQAQ